jgi:hypothetical protein
VTDIGGRSPDAWSAAPIPVAALLVTTFVLVAHGMGPRDSLGELASRPLREDAAVSNDVVPTLPELTISKLRFASNGGLDDTVADFRRRQGMDAVPELVTDFIRALPEGTIVEAPTPEILLIPVYANVYVTNIGGYILDEPFMQRYYEDGSHPIWGKPGQATNDLGYFSQQRAVRLLQEMGVRLIVLPPRYAQLGPRLKEIGSVNRFESGGWSVLEWQAR